MTFEGYVSTVTKHDPQCWQKFVRTTVGVHSPEDPTDGILVDIWEDPMKCWMASKADQARKLKIPVRVTYYETRQKFLRCTDVRFLEKTDVPQAEAHQPTGA